MWNWGSTWHLHSIGLRRNQRWLGFHSKRSSGICLIDGVFLIPWIMIPLGDVPICWLWPPNIYHGASHLRSSQAFHLNCGFNCIKKCHLCDAQDWHNLGRNALWRETCGNERSDSPFATGHIPLLAIPGMSNETILPDSLHCFHLGWGQDLGASGIVLLCKLEYFRGAGRNKLNAKLADAYVHFTEWLSKNKKSSGIDFWSKLKLDMASILFMIVHFISYEVSDLLSNFDFYL